MELDPAGGDETGLGSEGAEAAGAVAGALGAACALSEGCSSGFCVDGRCCERACDGVCEACSAEGLCNAFPADDQRCPPIACGSGNLCATFGDEQASNRCSSDGVCKSECDPTFSASGIACEEYAQGIKGLCDGIGVCVDPRALPGQACSSDRDCRDLPCVDGVCCQGACAGDCESCDPTGACVPDAIGSACGEARQCFGPGLCRQALGSACAANEDCGSGICAPAVGGGAVCCSEPCASGLLCNGDGACVVPESDFGSLCTTNADCAGGRCFDGRCCDVACDGACEQCDAAERPGRCVAIPAGTQDVASELRPTLWGGAAALESRSPVRKIRSSGSLLLATRGVLRPTTSTC